MRLARRLTQLQLAMAAEVSERTVRAAETGKRVRMDSLEQIAMALGAGMSDLISDRDELRSAILSNEQVDQLLLGIRIYGESFDISEFARVVTKATVIELVGPKEIPFTGEYTGVDGLKRLRDEAETSFDYLSPPEITAIRASGGIVVIRGNDRLQSLATGISEEFWWQHVYEFDRGKIAHMTETFDTLKTYRIFCENEHYKSVNGRGGNGFPTS